MPTPPATTPRVLAELTSTPRIFGFAILTGLVAAASTFVAYADLGSDGSTIDQSRTV